MLVTLPGKILNNIEAKAYLQNPYIQKCTPVQPPRLNYFNQEANIKLPMIVVYTAFDNKYRLMTPTEFTSKEVQKVILQERADTYGELVSQERVGS